MELMTDQDGNYTPEERSRNASQQLRDAKGRFTKTGAIVHVQGNNRSATVIGVNVDKQTVKIRYPDGTVQEVPVKNVVNIGDSANQPSSGRKFNPKDIQAEPRAIGSTPKAILDKLLPPMDAAALKKVVEDYQAFIEEERKRKLASWAALTPDTTDVPPLFLAQVDELDKQAVVELLSLVPLNEKSSEVICYRRDQGGWVRDDQMLRRSSPPVRRRWWCLTPRPTRRCWSRWIPTSRRRVPRPRRLPSPRLHRAPR
jgi:hypothetical protein